jgi:single-strand DNA-binding protein
MTGYNKVILMGHLTKDPETKTLPNSETTVCNFALAVNRTWKDADGNEREEVLFIDCAAFGEIGATIGQYLAKGRPIHIEGRLKLARWEQDGQSRSKVRVIVEQFRFVDSRRDEQAESAKSPKRKTPNAPRTRNKPARNDNGNGTQMALAGATAGEADGDGIPF